MKQGFKNMAARIVQAENDFLETLCSLGEISQDQAQAVFAHYKANGGIKLDAVIGRYSVKHGALLDRDLIREFAGIVE